MNIWKHDILQTKYNLLLENRDIIYHYNINTGECELIAFSLEKFWKT